jgi:hypothetical protein
MCGERNLFWLSGYRASVQASAQSRRDGPGIPDRRGRRALDAAGRVGEARQAGRGAGRLRIVRGRVPSGGAQARGVSGTGDGGATVRERPPGLTLRRGEGLAARRRVKTPRLRAGGRGSARGRLSRCRSQERGFARRQRRGARTAILPGLSRKTAGLRHLSRWLHRDTDNVPQMVIILIAGESPPSFLLRLISLDPRTGAVVKSAIRIGFSACHAELHSIPAAAPGQRPAGGGAAEARSARRSAGCPCAEPPPPRVLKSGGRPPPRFGFRPYPADAWPPPY